MATRAQLEAQLRNLEATLVKVQGELNLALHPVEHTFAITGLLGIFADDVAVAVGDTAHVVVLRGRVGQMNTSGIWNDIADGTVVEYWTTRGSVSSNKAIEAWYAA